MWPKITHNNSSLVGKSRIAVDDMEANLSVPLIKRTKQFPSLSSCDILVSLESSGVSYLAAWWVFL